MTLTTETIKQWRSDAENIARRSCVYETEYSAAEAILALTAELLANREARPVAYMYKDNIHADARFSLYKRFGNWSQEDINKYEITEIPLYTAPPAPAVPDDYQHLKNVQELYHDQEERLFSLAQRIKGVSFDKYSHTTAQAIDVLERAIFGDDGNACRTAMLAAALEGAHAYNALK